MAFIASQATQAEALIKAMQRALWVKNVAQAAVDRLSSNTGADYILGILDNIRLARAELQTHASVPGIGAYAAAQLNNAGYNVASEFTAMTAAMQQVVSWVSTNFPKDGNGFILAYTMDASGVRIPRQFTPAQTSGLVTQLNALIATIA
jgi:hypothetical protein